MADPTAIVADSDVLAGDLLVGGHARGALSIVREHSWLTLVASEKILTDTVAVIETLASAELAADWRGAIEDSCRLVDHRPGDQPALAATAASGAAHVLSFDDRLLGVQPALTLKERLECSIKPPDGFVRLFDPAPLFEHEFDAAYPGPDESATEW